MANVKTLEERIAKLEAEKRKTAEGFGEKVIDYLDVTTPAEFGKFLKENSEGLNEALAIWREKKTQRKQQVEDSF